VAASRTATLPGSPAGTGNAAACHRGCRVPAPDVSLDPEDEHAPAARRPAATRTATPDRSTLGEYGDRVHDVTGNTYCGSMSELEPSKMRISDADRNKVAEILREAAGDGRIDLTELDERLDATYAAKTYAELVPITHDLAPVVHAAPSSISTAGRERAVAIMGGVERRGIWVVPRHFDVFCLMGGAELDLREATFSGPEVTLTINTFMGGANIIVNQTTNVVVHGVGIMGGFSAPRSDPGVRLTADSPTVHLKGVAIMGGVSVVRKRMPGEDKSPGWRYRH